jgi:glutamate racemase
MHIHRDIVGIFDSGVGGMSVLKEIRELMPTLDIIYVGDNARAPYGNRTEEEVVAFTKEILLFLKEQGCTHFVSACNSISAMVTEEILKDVGIELSQYVDMVSPTKNYIMHTPTNRLIVLATVLTTKSGIYKTNLGPYVGEYIGVGEPHLARQIEFNEPSTLITQTVQSFFDNQTFEEDTHILLSCTHYPLVRHVFEEEIKNRNIPAHIVDPSVYVADELYTRVDETQGDGSVTVYTTQASDTMQKLMNELGLEAYTITTLS